MGQGCAGYRAAAFRGVSRAGSGSPTRGCVSIPSHRRAGVAARPPEAVPRPRPRSSPCGPRPHSNAPPEQPPAEFPAPRTSSHPPLRPPPTRTLTGPAASCTFGSRRRKWRLKCYPLLTFHPQSFPRCESFGRSSPPRTRRDPCRLHGVRFKRFSERVPGLLRALLLCRFLQACMPVRMVAGKRSRGRASSPHAGWNLPRTGHRHA
jgi:hypothetical protein